MERAKRIFTTATSKVNATAKKAFTKARPHKKPLAIGLVVVVVGIGILMSQTTGVPGIIDKPSDKKSSSEYQRELREAVDTAAGQPRDGRDPASQSQNSLANAASQPDGPGQRTDSPASGVNGGGGGHTGASDPNGVTSSGCIVGYGKGGQCLPTTGGNDHTITCAYVHEKGFHDGLAVTGDDQYNLDKNDDKIACSHGD